VSSSAVTSGLLLVSFFYGSVLYCV
jgi:hypothetical protein